MAEGVPLSDGEYVWMRDQMSESEYLAAAVASAGGRAAQPSTAGVHANVYNSTTPSTGDADVSALPRWQQRGPAPAGSHSNSCSSCIELKRQRAAAGTQLQQVTRQASDLENEVAALEDRLAAAREAAMRLWAACTDAGVEIDVAALGLEELLLGDGGTSGASGSASDAAAASAAASVVARSKALEFDDLRGSGAEDVYTEGDGRFCNTPVADFKPHGGANVLCAAAMPLIGDNDGAAAGSSSSPDGWPSSAIVIGGGGFVGPTDSIVISGGADKRLVVSLLSRSSDSSVNTNSGDNEAMTLQPQLLTFMTLSAPVLAIAVSPALFTHRDAHPTAATRTQARRYRSGVIAAACMDGHVHVLAYSLVHDVTPPSHITSPLATPGENIGCSDTIIRGGTTRDIQFSLTPSFILHDHTKYVTRLAWSADGALLCTGSADGSAALYSVGCTWTTPTPAFATNTTAVPSSSSSASESIGDGVSSKPVLTISPPVRLQQFYFARGAVEAMAWCKEQVRSQSSSVATTATGLVDALDTLILSVRGAPVLYYLRVLRSSSGGTNAAMATLMAAGGLGQPQPVLASANAVASSSSVATSTADCDFPRPPGHRQHHHQQLQQRHCQHHLWLYRVPLSEDGPRVDVSMRHLVAVAGATAATATALMPSSGGSAPAATPVVLGPVDDVRIDTGSVGNHTGAADDADDDDIDGDAARVRAALRGRHVTSSDDGTLAGEGAGHSSAPPALGGWAPGSAAAAAAASAVSSHTSAFIRVGFTIVDLAVQPVAAAPVINSKNGISGGGASAAAVAPLPLIAAASDSGVIYCYTLGTNSIVRRLVGHQVSSTLQAGTRLAWHTPSSSVLSLATSASEIARNGTCSTSSAGLASGGGTAIGVSYYLAATSDRDFVVVLYSIGSGRMVGRLGRTTTTTTVMSQGNGVEQGSAVAGATLGHTGTIKDLCFVASRSSSSSGSQPLMLSCGFDKRIIGWGMA